MESDYGSIEGSQFSSKDVISNMPEEVITNILDRLPIQDAVKTSILSRNWRFRWTMITRLVFDVDFYDYILTTKGKLQFYRRNITPILLQLKGHVTTFILCMPADVYTAVYHEHISHWIRFLSEKGMEEIMLLNMHRTPLMLPTHLFSCLKLKHMILHNCRFHPVPGFQGFPNLLSFHPQMVTFESCEFGEFIILCPSLELLTLNHDSWNGKVPHTEIRKLVNLKFLTLALCELDNFAITSFGIIRLLGSLPKLRTLDLDFQMCQFLKNRCGKKRIRGTLLRLKILALSGMDFNNSIMVKCVRDLIHRSPKLQKLKITGTQEDSLLPPSLSSWKLDCDVIGKMQLQNVELECMRGSEIEIDLIKSLLAYSTSLKKMVIKQRTVGGDVDDHKNYTFARKLLELRRASPFVNIELS